MFERFQGDKLSLVLSFHAYAVCGLVFYSSCISRLAQASLIETLYGLHWAVGLLCADIEVYHSGHGRWMCM